MSLIKLAGFERLGVRNTLKKIIPHENEVENFINTARKIYTPQHIGGSTEDFLKALNVNAQEIGSSILNRVKKI